MAYEMAVGIISYNLAGVVDAVGGSANAAGHSERREDAVGVHEAMPTGRCYRYTYNLAGIVNTINKRAGASRGIDAGENSIGVQKTMLFGGLIDIGSDNLAHV